MTAEIHKSSDSLLVPPQRTSSSPTQFPRSYSTNQLLDVPQRVIHTSSSTIWSENNGTGPNILGKAWSVGSTALQFLQDCVSQRTSNTNSPNSVSSEFKYRSTFLRSSSFTRFLDATKAKVDFEYSPHLCLTAIKNIPQEAMKAHLEEIKLLYEKGMFGKENRSSSDIPWVIPVITTEELAIANATVVEINHIVAIVIKNGSLFYYDSKGFTSDKRKWQDSLTVRDLVDLCGGIFLPNTQYEILENGCTGQYNLHNCAAFTALFIYQNLVYDFSFDQFDQYLKSLPDSSTLRDFVQEGIQGNFTLSPVPSPKRTPSPSISLRDKGEDFDMSEPPVST